MFYEITEIILKLMISQMGWTILRVLGKTNTKRESSFGLRRSLHGRYVDTELNSVVRQSPSQGIDHKTHSLLTYVYHVVYTTNVMTYNVTL